MKGRRCFRRINKTKRCRCSSLSTSNQMSLLSTACFPQLYQIHSMCFNSYSRRQTTVGCVWRYIVTLCSDDGSRTGQEFTDNMNDFESIKTFRARKTQKSPWETKTTFEVTAPATFRWFPIHVQSWSDCLLSWTAVFRAVLCRCVVAEKETHAVFLPWQTLVSEWRLTHTETAVMFVVEERNTKRNH